MWPVPQAPATDGGRRPRKVTYTKAMAPRLAARSVIVCILMLGGSIARSAPAAAPARRPVAVIALADDAKTEQFANTIGSALVNHDTLGPLEQGSMIGALIGEFLDENRDQIASAQVARVRAEGALANFVFPVAISMAQTGHESLHTVRPTTGSNGLYADLALLQGIAYLGQGKQAEAVGFFGLVHRLSPGRRLDPALYLPAVVQAFEAARSVRARPAQLVIKGQGQQLWLDGNEQKGTVWSFDVPEGLHVVWLAGPERETVGRQVHVTAGQQNVLDLGDAPAPQKLKVQRVRHKLSQTTTEVERAERMRRLAALLGVHDAVLIKIADGKLLVQTWHDRAEGELRAGFSAWRLAEGEDPFDLLRPLVPPVRPSPERPRRPRTADRPWYRRRGIQASIAVGVLGAVVGSVMFARSRGDGEIGLDHDVTFLPPKMAGQ